MKDVRCLLISVFALGLPSVAFSQVQQCTDLTKALKEFSISTSSSDHLNSVFDNYCEASGSMKAASAGFGIDTVVKAIPIKFTGSYANNEEAMKNFCKNYSSTTAIQERTFSYKEKIASKALETVSDCLRLQSQEKVIITHDIVNRDRSTFFLKSSLDKKIKLSGVAVTGPVKCTGQIDRKSTPFNDSTNVTVSNSQNFICTRTPSLNAQKVKIYDESTISVATDLGNYNVFWPQDELVPEEMASKIGLDIVRMQGKLDTLTSRITENERQTKEEIKSNFATNVINNAACIAGWPCILPAHDSCVSKGFMGSSVYATGPNGEAHIACFGKK